MPFIDAPSEFKRTNLFVDISGEEKTGKTTLALTARPKIHVIDLNDGLDGVVQKAVKKLGVGKIRVAHHPLPQFSTREKLKAEAGKLWEIVTKDVRDAATVGGTVMFDTGTELDKLARYSSLGALKSDSNKGALDYEQRNSMMRGTFHMFHAFKANFIVVHQVKEEWKDKKPTGKMVVNGWDEIGYDTQLALRTFKRVDADGLHFGATLITCRFDPALEGTEFTDDLCSLPYIMGFVTSTEEEMWR